MLEGIDVFAVVEVVVVAGFAILVVGQRKDLDRPNLGPELVNRLHLEVKTMPLILIFRLWWWRKR